MPSPKEIKVNEALSASIAAPEQPQAQRVELDEAGGVALVVGAFVVLEGHDLFRIEAVGRLAADHVDAALVELEPHGARHLFLTVIDRGLAHLASGRETEAVLDQFGLADRPEKRR